MTLPTAVKPVQKFSPAMQILNHHYSFSYFTHFFISSISLSVGHFEPVSLTLIFRNHLLLKCAINYEPSGQIGLHDFVTVLGCEKKRIKRMCRQSFVTGGHSISSYFRLMLVLLFGPFVIV